MKKNSKEAFNYYKYLQLKALDCIFNPDDVYFHRKICRWYSKEFSTPLDQVMRSDFGEILTHYYENQFENLQRNDLIDIMIDDHLPELTTEKDDEVDEWVENLEAEQLATLEKKEKKQSLNNQTIPVVKNQPSTSKTPLQPEDIVMKFDDEDFDDE